MACADLIYEADGQVWLEKRVGQHTLVAGNIMDLNTTAINMDYVRVPKTTLPDSVASLWTTGVTGALIVSGFVEIAHPIPDLSANTYSLSKDANYLYLTVPKATYANLAAAQAALAGTIVQYQLATPQLINLTEQGLAEGELMAFEDGTVYNGSDTFHSPDMSFTVTSNRAAQIDSLLQSANTQAKQLEAKANKVQEDWITPTLLNGWTGTLGFRKNSLGELDIVGEIVPGTTASGTTMFILPVGYRPAVNRYVAVCGNSAGTQDLLIRITYNGEVQVYTGTAPNKYWFNHTVIL